MARHWNTHGIRPYPNQDTPSGKPDMLFFLPEMTDSQDYKTQVGENDLQITDENVCKERTSFGCREEFSEVILLIMEDNNLSMPTRVDEAEELFLTLVTELQSSL